MALGALDHHPSYGIQGWIVFSKSELSWNLFDREEHVLNIIVGVCSQPGVWEALLAALEVLIRADHPQQMFNVKQLLRARAVHHFLLTCQVLQVLSRSFTLGGVFAVTSV